MANYVIGQRVGILIGVQSVSGPHVGATGIVVRTIYPWGSREYVVRDNVTGEELVYPPYLLAEVEPAPGEATASERLSRIAAGCCIDCNDTRVWDDGHACPSCKA